MAQLKHTLSNVREDVETVCRKEVEDLKEKYNEKLSDMLQHIRNLDAELSEKGLHLNKSLRYGKTDFAIDTHVKDAISNS